MHSHKKDANDGKNSLEMKTYLKLRRSLICDILFKYVPFVDIACIDFIASANILKTSFTKQKVVSDSTYIGTCFSIFATYQKQYWKMGWWWYICILQAPMIGTGTNFIIDGLWGGGGVCMYIPPHYSRGGFQIRCDFIHFQNSNLSLNVGCFDIKYWIHQMVIVKF